MFHKNAPKGEIDTRRGALSSHWQSVIPELVGGRAHEQQQAVCQDQFLVWDLNGGGAPIAMPENKVALRAQGEAGNRHVGVQLLLVVPVEAHLVQPILVSDNITSLHVLHVTEVFKNETKLIINSVLRIPIYPGS
jgi:hypothetical protein